METAWKHEPACKHIGRMNPRQNGISCVFRKFELNRSPGFALVNRKPFFNPIILDQLGHCEFDQIAPRSVLSNATLNSARSHRLPASSSRADYPDLFRQEREFWANDAAFVPGAAIGGGCGQLNSRHGLASNPPSRHRHQHRADGRFYHPFRMAGPWEAARRRNAA